jgi:hypothetical protein
MLRLAYPLLAAAVLTVASTPAHARYQVIRWTSGWCQVWNHAIPGRPFPDDWKPSKHIHMTFIAALDEKMDLVKRGYCW